MVGVGVAEDLEPCSHGCGCERRVDLVILTRFPDPQSRNRKTYGPFHCVAPPWDRLLAVVVVDVGTWLVEPGALLS